jgi:hypothetical protein
MFDCHEDRTPPTPLSLFRITAVPSRFFCGRAKRACGSDKPVLDKFPTIITASTFFVLVLAVTHEWGYFWVIGTHFQTLMSPSDYLSSGLLWLPYLGIWCFFVIALSRLQERFKQPEPPPSRYWIVNFLRSIHFYGLSIIVWALLGFFLLSTSWAPIVFAAALAYAWLLFFLAYGQRFCTCDSQISCDASRNRTHPHTWGVCVGIAGSV